MATISIQNVKISPQSFGPKKVDIGDQVALNADGQTVMFLKAGKGREWNQVRNMFLMNCEMANLTIYTVTA